MHAPQGYAGGVGSYPTAPPSAGVNAAAGAAGYPRTGQPASQGPAVWAGGQLVSSSPQYVQPQAAQLTRNLSTEGWPAGGAVGVPRPPALQHGAYQQTGPLGRVPSGQGLHAPMLGPAAPAYHAPGPTSQGPFTFFGPGQSAVGAQPFHFEATAAAAPEAPAGQRERAAAATAPAEAAAHAEEAAAPPPRPPPPRQPAAAPAAPAPAAPAQQRAPPPDTQSAVRSPPVAPPQPQRQPQPPQAAGGGGAGPARPEQATAAASTLPRELPTFSSAEPAPQGAERAARRSELIRQSFAFVDRLRTGHINQNQNQMGLQMVFQQLDAPLPKDEWFVRVFKNFSHNERGLIDYKSFKEIVVQWDEHHLKKRQAATPPARDSPAAGGTAVVAAQKQQASSDPASTVPPAAPASTSTGDSGSERAATATSDRDVAAATLPSKRTSDRDVVATATSDRASGGSAPSRASNSAEGGVAAATVSRSSSSARAAAAELKSEVMFPTYHGQLAIFDDYEFFGDVGAGTFGKVMVVRHKQTKQMRACKVVAVSNPLQRELADTEICLLKSLNHPNIMKMHEVYFENSGGRNVTNGNIYLVTELCEGGDLFSRILHHYGRLKQPMTESHVAFMMTQILSATKYCHEKGIVHRDIKPENILFVDRSSSSPLKIIDFGLANFTEKIREQAKEVDLPRSGRLGQLARLLPAVNGKHVIPLQERKKVMQKAGTPHYMAPEMIEGEYDQLADMFSIGIILCQLFTGWHPFYQPGDDEVSVRVKISDPEPVRFPADIWEFVSQKAQDLCSQLLDKDPRTRLSAAQALRHPWFEDGKPSAFGNKEVLSVSIFDGLMKYQAYNKLKRAVLQLLTRELSEFQIQELRNKFMGLDTQGDGLLSPEELIEGMRSVGYQMSDSDLSQIVAALDGTGSQRIGYKEFISALIERRVKFDRQQLWECFKKFDVQSNGKITYQDVKRAMSGSISESEWQEIAALPGRPVQQAELTFDEFVAIMDQQDC